MLQWGNVFLCKGKRLVDAAAAAGRDVADVTPQAEAEFAAAEAKYLESRRIKADFYDAYVSLGNLEFERAKLVLGLAVPAPLCALFLLCMLIHAKGHHDVQQHPWKGECGC